jgi:hypothetical protein
MKLLYRWIGAGMIVAPTFPFGISAGDGDRLRAAQNVDGRSRHRAVNALHLENQQGSGRESHVVFGIQHGFRGRSSVGRFKRDFLKAVYSAGLQQTYAWVSRSLLCFFVAHSFVGDRKIRHRIQRRRRPLILGQFSLSGESFVVLGYVRKSVGDNGWIVHPIGHNRLGGNRDHGCLDGKFLTISADCLFDSNPQKGATRPAGPDLDDGGIERCDGLTGWACKQSYSQEDVVSNFVISRVNRAGKNGLADCFLRRKIAFAGRSDEQCRIPLSE